MSPSKNPPIEAGPILPIALSSETWWEVLRADVSESGLDIHGDLFPPAIGLTDSKERKRMRSLQVPLHALVEELDGTFDNDPITLTISGSRRKNNEIIVGFDDSDGILKNRRQIMAAALVNLTGTNVLQVDDRSSDFHFSTKIGRFPDVEIAGDVWRGIVSRADVLRGEEVDFDPIVIGQPQFYANDAPPTDSPLDGRTHPIKLSDTNPHNTEKVSDLFFLLDDETIALVASAQEALQDVGGFEPQDLNYIFPRLLSTPQRKPLRKAALSVDEISSVVQSVLSGDRSSQTVPVQALRSRPDNFIKQIHRVGFSLTRSRLADTSNDVLDLVAQIAHRHISRNPRPPLYLVEVGSIPAEQHQAATQVLLPRIGHEVVCRGVVVETVDKDGRHIHVIPTDQPESATEQPDASEPSELPIAEEVSTEQYPDDEATQPQASAEDVDEPGTVATEPQGANEHQRSLILTDLHRDIQHAAETLRRPTLATITAALPPGTSRKEVRRAVQQLVGHKYLTQDGSAYRPVNNVSDEA